MYKIERAPYGIRLTFGGFIENAEMERWVEESTSVLAAQQGGFGVFVDMRTLKPLPQDSKATMEKGQRAYKEKGMTRSVVILESALVTIQFKRIAQESGIYQWERYLDASAHPDWEAVGVAWVRDGVDPDKPA